jgi:hypothetical protein
MLCSLVEVHCVCSLLYAGHLLCLLFDPENGYIDELLAEHMTLDLRR